MDYPREQLLPIALIGAGGFIGAVSRHGVDVVVGIVAGSVALPLGTLAVNVLGSFALGALTRVLGNRRLRLFLATGLLSSFTTYSTFAVETVQLSATWGAVNVVVTYALGILAAIAGVTVSLGNRSGRDGSVGDGSGRGR